MGCFSICWLPYFIVACAQIFNECNITPPLYKAAFSLAMTNSALNPVIYSWKNASFRLAFVQLIRCKSPNCYQRSLMGSCKLSPVCFKRHSLSSNDLQIDNADVRLADSLPTVSSVYTVSDPSYCL